MKTFPTASLLLVGLVSSCTARNIDAGVDPDQGSSSSSLEDSSEIKELVQQIETACYEKTGSNQTFQALSISVALVPMCFMIQIDGVEFMDGLNRLKTNASSRHEFFPRFCPQIRNLLTCFDPPIYELSKCLDDDDVLILQGTYGATPQALDLICKNDGEILFQEGATLDVCLKNYSNYSAECASLVSNSTMSMSVSKFGESQCGELSQVRGCLERKFNECNGPKLMDIFDVFWKAVLKNSPCGNFITGPNEIEADKAR